MIGWMHGIVQGFMIKRRRSGRKEGRIDLIDSLVEFLFWRY